MTQTASSSLRCDLARTIAEHRGGWKAGHLADAVLGRDRVSTYLVGLVENAEQVIYYDRARNAIVAYPFESGGLHGGERAVVDRVNQREELHTWIADREFERWAWIHPRYRWVYGFSKGGSDSLIGANL